MQNYRLPLSSKQLMEKSRAVTNIDIIDTDAVEPLEILVQSFNDDSHLHEAGATAIQIRLLRSLKNRLRMLRDFRDHPEIADQEVNCPIMMSGSFRTGSTKLQRMLAESGDFNWLPLWTGINFASVTGHPDEDVAARIDDAREYVSYNSRMSPDLDAAHNHDLFAPEEETYVGNQSFFSSGYFGFAQVPSYLQWLGRQDSTQYYRFVKNVLKYLQWQGLADPAKKWLLKSPLNLGMEKAVKTVFPDADFVMTHRLPTQTLASLFSLLDKLYKCHTDDSIGDAGALAAGQAMNMERHMRFRKDNLNVPILDVHYRETTTAPLDAVRRVYEFADARLSDGSIERMASWDANNPIHKQGSHVYTLEQYGLTAQAVTDLCPDYMRFYSNNFGSFETQEMR